MNRLKRALTTVAVLAFTTVAAAAHKASYGYIAGANAGEVDFWFGTYHGNGSSVAGIPFESQFSLSGAGGTVYSP